MKMGSTLWIYDDIKDVKPRLMYAFAGVVYYVPGNYSDLMWYPLLDVTYFQLRERICSSMQ